MALSSGSLWQVAVLLVFVNLLLLLIYFHVSHGDNGAISDRMIKNVNLRSYLIADREKINTYSRSIEVNADQLVPKQYSRQMSEEFAGLPLDSDLLKEASKNATPSLRYEERVNQYARYYNKYKSEYESTNKTNLLCSTFIDLNEANIEFVSRNILHSDNTCDWLIIVYKFDAVAKDSLIELFKQNVTMVLDSLSVNKSKQTKIKVFLEFAIEKTSLLSSIVPLCEKYVRRATKANQPTEFNPCDFRDFPHLHHIIDPVTGQTLLPELPPRFNHLLYPKIVLFISYLKYVSRYHYIWSLDSDISLESFDMHYFLRIFGCSFPKPPIVSQPLISPSTQAYSYLNYDVWRQMQEFQMSKFNRTLKSSPSGFVEIQAPLFNAFFLEFYIMAFLVPLLTPTFILGGDWGYDEIFCAGARAFARQVLESPFVPQSKNSTIPCALIIDGTPVLHANKHTTDNIVGIGNKLALDCELVRLVSTTFPSYSANGNVGGCSPDSNKNYVKVFELRDNCKFEN